MSYHDIDPTKLEPIDSPAALAWAENWSDATEAAHPREELRARLREVLDTDDRIPYVSRRGEHLYNFWRDGEHPRGLWRRTTLESYLTPSPEWEVLVDVDKLAAEEDEDWVWKGASVRAPEYDLALLRLSRGGADAVVIREFDMQAATFVEERPFTLPEAKSNVSWVDEDTLLVGTDTGEGSLTSSGYPLQARLWRRGEDIAEAEVLATGEHEDVLLAAGYEPVGGHTVMTRALDFYHARVSVDVGGELQPLEIPEDCESMIHGDWLLLNPRTEFAGVPAGGLGKIALAEFVAGSRDVEVVFSPTPRTSLQALSVTENYLVVTVLDDVATSIALHPFAGGEAIRLELPELVTASVVATNAFYGDEVWVSASSFTEPATLYRWDGFVLTAVKKAPAQFDAAGLETRQHWVTSADGTQLPYFITGDFSRGTRPTLVGGYGGFEVSLTPGYSAVRGLAWLERGNFFVQPNLRGGGEFGPQWHSQVVKTNRHKVWQDHEAVLTDIVERGYAEPEQIGIRGGSNGGLLTSGALTQYPQRLGAAVIQVPLTDMLRYHTWSAGASWMAEYGNPDDPAERAAIESWSPLHNVSPEPAYPPALVTTSTRDDRVHPAHARLFAHALSAAGQPVDYFENTAGGHAGAADNDQVARVESLIYSWLTDRLG